MLNGSGFVQYQAVATIDSNLLVRGSFNRLRPGKEMASRKFLWTSTLP